MPAPKRGLNYELHMMKAGRIINDCINHDEGGWVYTDYDVPTFAGMTLPVFNAWMDEKYPDITGAIIKQQASDFADTPHDLIVECYQDMFYDKAKIGEMPPFLRDAVFSAAVNLGPRRAVICLQRVSNRYEFFAENMLKEDGIYGPKTASKFDELQQALTQDKIINAFCFAWINRYVNVVMDVPELVKFLRGWINRVERYVR